MSLLDAFGDDEFRGQVRSGLLDVANRGVVAGLLGAPVDLTAMAMRPFGYSDAAPVMGSEWIGRKMQDAGLVSANRYPVAEGLAGLLDPVTAAKAPAMALAMSPAGKARLLADLLAGKGSGTYRLGDVTPGQAKGLDALFGRPTAGPDVMMTNETFRHLLQKRLHADGFTPEEVTRFTEQAMAKRSLPDLNTSKQNQHPSLLSPTTIDPATGRAYEARMPLSQSEHGYEVRSVVPERLPGKNKTPRP